MTRALMIAAPASGAGKTTLTLGLLRAFRRRGVAVAGAKSGPDYIDPAFHEAACGRPSFNLDTWAMPPRRLRALAGAGASGAELLIIEAAVGLFDGAPDTDRPEGRGSAADLAAALGVPVVLAMDVARQSATAAAIFRGVAAHRPDVEVVGAILNRLGSPRHEAMIRRAMDASGARVLGALPRAAALVSPERHLGLVQARERADLEGFLEAAADAVEVGVDLEALAALARPLPAAEAGGAALAPLGGRLALARDDAFSFVYPHHLADWRRAGAEILPFSPLNDEAPDASADAVFLPGGYPELHAGRLAAAVGFKAGLRRAAERGALVYGECGGYMALGEGLEDAAGGRHEMLGLLPLETSFARRRLSLGYRRLRPLAGAPWGGPLMGHEFHYATTLREGAAHRLFQTADAENRDLGAVGLRVKNVLGSFIHLIDDIFKQ